MIFFCIADSKKSERQISRQSVSFVKKHNYFLITNVRQKDMFKKLFRRFDARTINLNKRFSVAIYINDIACEFSNKASFSESGCSYEVQERNIICLIVSFQIKRQSAFYFFLSNQIREMIHIFYRVIVNSIGFSSCSKISSGIKSPSCDDRI